MTRARRGRFDLALIDKHLCPLPRFDQGHGGQQSGVSDGQRTEAPWASMTLLIVVVNGLKGFAETIIMLQNCRQCLEPEPRRARTNAVERQMRLPCITPFRLHIKTLQCLTLQSPITPSARLSPPSDHADEHTP